ncbi:MAG: DUF5682 family protein [Armatimonas sp.]
MTEFPNTLLDLEAQVVFLPVRHHSPACARLALKLIQRLQPRVVLIEGPANFNERRGELLLDHTLPIAIYAFAPGAGHGVYYPLCIHSPEWQALRSATEFRFIDLPWHDYAGKSEEQSPNLYGDGAMSQSGFIDALCQQLEVEKFDDAWDLLFEVDETTTEEALFERLHHFCFALRSFDEACGVVRQDDRLREAFMAEQIRAEIEQGGRILVVTGGYHSVALHQGVNDQAVSVTQPPFPPVMGVPESPSEPPITGGKGGMLEAEGMDVEIALTPYSEERLDALTGYASGLPSPGFYRAAWEKREERILAEAAHGLRKRGQVVSAADLIAAEAVGRGLANLRGHARPWRRDLIDAVRSAFVKDAVEGETHPMLEALFAQLRGGARGRLAEGTPRPPLVDDVFARLAEWDLTLTEVEQKVTISLLDDTDRERSRVLHRVAALPTAGVKRVGGTDFAARTDMARPGETWSLRWTPETDASLIEAAALGGTLEEAAAGHLARRIEKAERDAEEAALTLLSAAQMGLLDKAWRLLPALGELLDSEADFVRLTKALGHLLYLWRYDEALGALGGAEPRLLLERAYIRGMWLLATVIEGDDAIINGLAGLVEVARRDDALDREALGATLTMVAGDSSRAPALRGAAAGGLWSLGDSSSADLLGLVRRFGAPDALGDFLHGVFTLAREAIRRDPALLIALDEVLMHWDDEEFLAALPPLRLAFARFPPREKHHIAVSLLEATEGADAPPMLDLLINPEDAAEAMALEARLFSLWEKYIGAF